MAFNRTWDTIVPTWEGETQTWDMGEGTAGESLAVELTEASLVTLMYVRGDSISPVLTESSTIDISLNSNRGDTLTVEITETSFLTRAIALEDTLSVSLGESGTGLESTSEREDTLSLEVMESSSTLSEDWPQEKAPGSVTWGKNLLTTGVWTKVPAKDGPNPW